MMKIKKHNYTTFQILHRNMKNLKTIRPDFYLNINVSDGGYNVEGELIKNMMKSNNYSEVDNYYSQVITINTSIILNATAFFEGALETLLVKRLDKIFVISSTNSSLYKKIKNDIIRCSSYGGLEKHFKLLFGCSIKKQLPSIQTKLNFVESFYHIRHELAHASEIQTEAIYSEKGGTLIRHNSDQYSKLFTFLENHYKLKKTPTADIQTILMFSTIIDDFSEYIQEIIEHLARELRNQKLINGDDWFWEKFTTAQ